MSGAEPCRDVGRHHNGTAGHPDDHYPNHNDVNSPASDAGGHSCTDHDHPRSTRAHGSTNEHHHDELTDHVVHDLNNRCPNDHDHHHHHHNHNNDNFNNNDGS